MLHLTFKGTAMKKLALSLVVLIVFLINVQAETTAPAALPTAAPQPTDPLLQHVSPPPVINARGYILMDAASGEVLTAKNPDQRMEPASLTKIMTMYVVSKALQAGQIRLTDMVPISKDAWRTGGSRMFIQVGTQIPAHELINGIVVASGNDASVAMAEYVGGGGSTENFINLMNQSATQLGMKNSHFADVNGLPISNHYSSPHDLAILAQAIIRDFPEDYKWYGQKWMQFGKIKQANRNRLLWRDPSVDGLKTGHTDAAGYCLVASAQRNGMRLISVVMGAPTSPARINDSQALLNWGFRNYSTHQLYAANQPLVAPRVWFGKQKQIALGLPQGLFVTIPNNQYQNLKAFMSINQSLNAPILKGTSYGTVEVTLNNQPIVTQPLIALQNNPQGNLFERTYDHIIKLF